MASSSSSVMNFVEPTPDIMEKLAEYLGESELISGGVHIYWKTDPEDLFNFLSSMRELPCAVLSYAGSTFQNVPRRIPKFTVFVLYRNLRDGEAGSSSAQEIVDDLIDQVDHQIYNQALFLVTGDEPIDLKGTGLVAYKIDFIAQDH